MGIQIGPKINAMQSAALDDSYLSNGNQMLRMLQALVQPNVLGVGTVVPPGSPANGATYVIGATGATGAWAGQGNSVAYYASPTGPPPVDANVAPGWDFYPPLEGWTVFNQGDGNQHRFVGPTGPWTVVTGASGLSINYQSGSSYTAVLSDNGNLVDMDYTGATASFGVPLHSSVPFPVGAVLAVEQTGPTGPSGIIITPAIGVTINTPSSLTTRVQYSIAGVVQNSVDVWTAVGDLT